MLPFFFEPKPCALVILPNACQRGAATSLHTFRRWMRHPSPIIGTTPVEDTGLKLVGESQSSNPQLPDKKFLGFILNFIWMSPVESMTQFFDEAAACISRFVSARRYLIRVWSAGRPLVQVAALASCCYCFSIICTCRYALIDKS